MDVKTHYDMLIEENNDPFRDPPVLQKYMELWDGQVFLDQMEPDPSKTPQSLTSSFVNGLISPFSIR